MNPQKQKGDRAELAVAEWLRKNGWPEADRIRAGYHRDWGDIGGLPGTVVSVKSEKRIDLAGYIDGLHQMMLQSASLRGVVVVKRRGESDPAMWYAVMPLYLLAELLPGKDT